MKLAMFEKNLAEQIRGRIRDVTPGLLVRAYQAGKLVLDLAVGETWAYYDLASLTKAIFSAQAMMLAFEEAKWNLDTTVKDILEWYPHDDIRIKDLLTHSAGYPGWGPVYKELDLSRPVEYRREELRKILVGLPLGSRDKAVYSDLGMMVVGFVLEKLYERPLIDVWKHIQSLFYEGTTLEFHPNNQVPGRAVLYAPTEECPWRGRLLQGEVHDENAWALGGVSTHAGLFGSLDDVGWVLLNYRSQLLGIGRSPIKMRTARLFTSRAIPEAKGDWALGFMMPTPGSASCGSHFSLASFGHTGFTGTSLWYDPKADLAVTILSNRVLYGRGNESFKKLRPEIHNWIVEGLAKASF